MAEANDTRDTIHIDLTVPAPIMGVDLVKMVTGLDIGPILAHLGRAPPWDQAGQRYYPLELRADDEGAILTMRTFGAFCVKNHKGFLAVFMPPSFQEAWEKKVPESVRGTGVSGNIYASPAIAYRLRLEPGAMATLPLPMIGILGIQLSPVQPARRGVLDVR